MAIAVGTLFLGQGRETLQDAQMYLSVSFFSIMTQFMVSFAAPGLLIERLPTYYKHRDAHFHPAWWVPAAAVTRGRLLPPWRCPPTLHFEESTGRCRPPRPQVLRAARDPAADAAHRHGSHHLDGDDLLHGGRHFPGMPYSHRVR